MRILALNYEYPPLGGGAGNASRQICRELARAGHEVAMLTSHFRGLPREEDDAGVRVYRTPVLRRRLEQCSPAEMASFIVAAAVPAVGWLDGSGPTSSTSISAFPPARSAGLRLARLARPISCRCGAAMCRVSFLANSA